MPSWPSGLGFNLSGSASKTKSHTWIDPRTRALQEQNYQGAQAIAPTYAPTSAEQISRYLNPYAGAVVDTSLNALDRTRRMAVNDIGDRAQAAHAFGGSRHGVAEALTNGQFAQQAGLLSADLFKSAYSQALDAAQRENQYAYQYPLTRQGVLSEALGRITPETFTKGSESKLGFDLGFGSKR